MCWKSNNLIAKKADKDIVVYKMGFIKNNIFTSYYRDGFQYNKNNSNLPIIKIQVINTNCIYSIEKGYHCYSKYCQINLNKQYFNIYSISGVKIDYYFYADIGKFIIPKGTIYYENKDGEIVSEKLIFVKKIPFIEFKKYGYYRFKELDCNIIKKLYHKIKKLL
jgi:hypothetical protein